MRETDGAEALLLGQQSRADENAADGEENIDADVAMLIEPARMMAPTRWRKS